MHIYKSGEIVSVNGRMGVVIIETSDGLLIRFDKEGDDVQFIAPLYVKPVAKSDQSKYLDIL